MTTFESQSPAWIQQAIADTKDYAQKVLLGEGQADTFASGGVLPSGFEPLGVMTEAPWIVYPDNSPMTWSTTTATTSDSDIVDRIDKLASEEKCWHCDRDYHTAPLTHRMWNMYEGGRFDPNYFTGEDTSPILCLGADGIGPARPKDWKAPTTFGWTTTDLSAMKQQLWSLQHSYSFTFKLNIPNWSVFDDAWNVLYSSKTPEPECDLETPEINVEFGPQNWGLDFQYTPQYKQLPITLYTKPKNAIEAKVRHLWTDFATPVIPTPERTGYDFDQILKADEFPQYPTTKKGKKP